MTIIRIRFIYDEENGSFNRFHSPLLQVPDRRMSDIVWIVGIVGLFSAILVGTVIGA